MTPDLSIWVNFPRVRIWLPKCHLFGGKDISLALMNPFLLYSKTVVYIAVFVGILYQDGHPDVFHHNMASLSELLGKLSFKSVSIK